MDAPSVSAFTRPSTKRGEFLAADALLVGLAGSLFDSRFNVFGLHGDAFGDGDGKQDAVLDI